MAVDDPLVHLLVDERAAKPDLRDNLWVRVLDVKAALEGRRYESDADVVLAITDAQVPENAGLWRVTIADGTGDGLPGGRVGARPHARDPGTRRRVPRRRADRGARPRRRSSRRTPPGAASALGRAMTSPIAPVSNFMF